jgi:hypothetical protein
LGCIPETLTIRSQPMIEVPYGARDVQVGDPEFDPFIKITGRLEQILSLSDHRTRNLILQEVLIGNAIVKHGCIELELSDLESTALRLTNLVRLAKVLSIREERIPRRLAKNAALDPLPSVRLKNFEVLQSNFPDHEFTQKTKRGLLTSRDPLLKYAAARTMGQAGLPALRDIALESSTNAELRRQALADFINSAVPEQAKLVLEELATEAQPTLTADVIRGAVRFGMSSIAQRLVKRIHKLDESSVTELIKLVNRRSAEAESILLMLLERDSVTIRFAVVEALGQVGSVRAVEPLLALTAGLLASPSVKQAAREAVARIQSRLGDAEAGRLSLAVPSGDAGALSLAGGEEAPGGELSLAEDVAERTAGTGPNKPLVREEIMSESQAPETPPPPDKLVEG